MEIDCYAQRLERKGGRVYYSLTPKGRTAQERVVKQIKKSQKEWEEKLLDILAMHAEVFNRRALHDLLERGKLLAKSL